MKNNYLSCVCDSVLSGFILFIVTNVFLRTVISSSVAVNILSVVFGTVVCLAIFFVLNGKNKNKTLKRQTEKKWKNILSELEIMPDNRLIDLFLPIFNGMKINKIENSLIITETNAYLFDYYEKTERERAVYLLKQSDGKSPALFCNELSDDCADFCKAHDITVYDKTALPDLQEKYNLTFPEPIKDDNKTTIIEKTKRTLIKFATFKRAASLAFSAAALFLFAKISFFPKWYRICGIILLLFSALLLAIKIVKDKK